MKFLIVLLFLLPSLTMASDVEFELSDGESLSDDISEIKGDEIDSSRFDDAFKPRTAPKKRNANVPKKVVKKEQLKKQKIAPAVAQEQKSNVPEVKEQNNFEKAKAKFKLYYRKAVNYVKRTIKEMKEK